MEEFIAFVCKEKRFAFSGFYPSSSPRLPQNIGEFGAKKYILQTTAHLIHCFRDSVPVRKMHDCYSRILIQIVYYIADK